MNSKVYVKDVWVEVVFELFWHSVSKDGGDGAACICCSNIDETAEAFVKWWLASNHNFNKQEEFYHPKDDYVSKLSGDRIINFHDQNENFMFCENEIDLGHGDLVIVIQDECYSGGYIGGDLDVTLKKLEVK